MLDLPFVFYNISIPEDNLYLVNVPSGIQTKNEVLAVFAKQLNFPDYFGWNWDALYDCLCDLSWISEKTIRIVHADIPSLENNSQRSIYLDILKDTVWGWKPDDFHKVEIFFPKNLELDVIKLLTD
ncbi:MAG: barstar family protein [Kiritimatiellae bacterium]|jgi:RNAse (barnase) inhibitor barstar|nr:barstar family protein [Kiritimatiellia bacterium]